MKKRLKILNRLSRSINLDLFYVITVWDDSINLQGEDCKELRAELLKLNLGEGQNSSIIFGTINICLD